MSAHPAWCSDPREIQAVADYLLRTDPMPAADMIDEIATLWERPWLYERQRDLMTGHRYECADCGDINETESDSRIEEAAEGEPLCCPDCDDSRRAEAAADAAEMDAEMRADAMLDERGL